MTSPGWLPDWIRINSDNRVTYWTGGKVGAGVRRQPRKHSRDAAETFARQLLVDAQRNAGLRADLGATWADLCQAWVDAHDGRIPESTFRARLSAINAWIVPHAGGVRCVDSELSTLVKVADAAACALGRSAFDGVVQTMSVVADWGRARAWLPADPLGADSDRRATLKRVRATVRVRTETEHLITMTAVPSWADVLALADALEDRTAHITGDRTLAELHGAAIRVAAGTGLRQCELLALDESELTDLDDGVIVVRHQLDRYRPWETGTPPVVPPKHHRPGRPHRRALVWETVREDLDRLRAHRHDDRTLIPRRPNVRYWADAWGKQLKVAAVSAGWRWQPHWLRHHYATVSYTPREHGGYGLPAAVVQQSLGHRNLSTFLDTYAHPPQLPSGWVS